MGMRAEVLPRSMGGTVVVEKRGIDDIATIQNTQESEDGKSTVDVPFMIEPPTHQCINIPSLESEINQI